MNLEALCAETIEAVEQIGQQIWLKSNDLATLGVTEKGAGDVATDIDLWAEGALRWKLQSLLPGSEFVGEESGGTLPAATHQPTWIVDPIDGTANFARGYPQWSVSVALVAAGQPLLGVIVDPHRQEVFYAAKGQGAWLKSRHGLQRITCSTVSEPLKATVSTVFPKPLSPLMVPYLAEFSRVVCAVGQVRRSGSMALELAYVAAGRADAFWERGMQAWDAAAGWALMQEAGATLTPLDGCPVLSSQMLAAGSPAMLDQLIQLLAGSAIKN